MEKTSLNDLYTEYNNSNIFVGFLILFIFFNSSAIANVINIDRERNIYSRIFLSPAKVWMYYLSNVLCNLVIVAFQILAAILSMEYFTNTSIGVEPGVLFLILFLTAMVAVSLGTFYVSITEEADAASMISNFANLLIVILGGCFIQVELFPKLINAISYISPARWAMGSILDLQQGLTLGDIAGKAVLLGGMAALILAISVIITSKREKEIQKSFLKWQRIQLDKDRNITMAELYYMNIEDPISAEDYQTLLGTCASDKREAIHKFRFEADRKKEHCTGKCWPDS
ncbi:ABC transporter permease [Paenibacillus rhizoplanae]